MHVAMLDDGCHRTCSPVKFAEKLGYKKRSRQSLATEAGCVIGKAGFLTRRSLSGDDRAANNLTLPSSLRQFLPIEVLGSRILY